MAKKRFKIKGKAPRGLSKYERQYDYAYMSRGGLGGGWREGNREMMSTVKRVNRDGTVEPHHSPIANKNPMSRPSSTRKKRVKEGNRKFIGPRQFKNELREDRDARDRTGGEILWGDNENLEGRWMEGKQYARLKPNKRLTPNQRALRRSKRRDIDTRLLDVWQLDPTLPIERVPANLRDLIKRKIKDPSSQKRMLRVLARAMMARGGSKSETDLEKDFRMKD